MAENSLQVYNRCETQHKTACQQTYRNSCALITRCTGSIAYNQHVHTSEPHARKLYCTEFQRVRKSTTIQTCSKVTELKKLHGHLQEAQEESAAGQANTSRRTSAKKRRGRARLRQRALRTPETIQEGAEENHDGHSDGDEQEENAFDLGRSAYDVARDQREKEREAQEHAEQERIQQERVLNGPFIFVFQLSCMPFLVPRRYKL